jgi:hypothetical protein
VTSRGRPDEKENAREPVLAALDESFDTLAKGTDNQGMDTGKIVSRHRLHMAAVAASMTFAEIARALQLAPTTFSAKLHGHRRWLSGEIETLSDLVGVSAAWLAGTGPDVPR